jgi:hypothetical protein
MHPDLTEYGPVRFHSDPNALYDRHLVFDYAIDPDLATPRERYEAVARSLRDVLALRWLRTNHLATAEHHEGGNHEKAGHHAHIAEGHLNHANHHAEEASKHHAQHHS